MTAEEVVRRAQEAGVRLVRFLYCDTDGVVRGKCTATSRLAERMSTGIGLTVAMRAFSMLDRLAAVPQMGPVGEVRLVPDPDTFVVAPYAPRTGVLLAGTHTLDGREDPADGRAFLKRMVARAAGADLTVVAAFEPEWTLARSQGDGYAPIDDSLCFSSDGMGTAALVIDDIVGALEAQGLAVEQYYPELGWGQQELSISHAPALRAADNHVLYRETVRAVARNHGLHATFAPKPWSDQAGNGCHLHLSVWDPACAVNRFHDAASGDGLSELARHFCAGLLEHLAALVALTCASVNSYRRLQPRTWASAYQVWGPDNREAALRVPSPMWGHEAESTNVELKASDSSANPYIALGGVIAAGLDGIERGLELPPGVTVDPADMSDSERDAIGGARLPTSLAVALDNLERDPVLLNAMGDVLATTYLAVKRRDVECFALEDQAFELRQHMLRF